MPQLDIHAWPPQLIWLAISFIGLYIVMTRLVIPKIGGTIQERRSAIENDLGRAQALKGETDAAVAAYEKELAEARGRAHAIAQEARGKLTAETDKERAKLDAELGGKIAGAEKQIAATKATALASAETLAAEIAADIVAELAGVKINKADAESAIARAGGR